MYTLIPDSHKLFPDLDKSKENLMNREDTNLTSITGSSIAFPSPFILFLFISSWNLNKLNGINKVIIVKRQHLPSHMSV